jgi:dihydropteroate synthase
MRSTHCHIQCADKILSLYAPKVMAILNLTPDSFYDGGVYCTTEQALRRVEAMILEGADIIDLGGESSQPYAPFVSVQQEIDRVMTVLCAIKERFGILLSIDTYKAPVMQEAIKLGVNIVNDIYALQQEGTLMAVANSQVAVCLMHMQGTPRTMQNSPRYSHIIAEIAAFLQQRVDRCLKAGIAKNRIMLDPGFGFGKRTDHNMCLLKNLSHLERLGFPLLVGLSRKASIGEILALPTEERLFGSISAHVIAVMQGAAIIRTHDVKPTVQAIKIAQAVLAQEQLEWQ